MRLSLRDAKGVEVDHAKVDDPKDAVYEAMRVLARRPSLAVGSLLVVDDDKSPRPAGTLTTVTVGHLEALAGRLEQRAGIIEPAQPLGAGDLRTAARFLRHAVKVGWIGSSVAVSF